MDNLETDKYMSSKSTIELSKDLTKMLNDYRLSLIDPDSTLSMPDFELICRISKEITTRLDE